MKNCNIGGQALIEGILMRNGDEYAISVRHPNKKIITKTEKLKSGSIQEFLKKIPLIRGVVNFLGAISLGYEALAYSAEIYEAKETSEADTVADSRKGKTLHSLTMGITMAVSLALSVSLFIVLPYLLASVFHRFGFSDLMIAVSEGAIRLMIFFAYMIFMSMIKDIRRVLMYHGAEHKCINCIEHELALTVENVKHSSRFHKRCGTGFLFYIVAVSIILFMFIKVDMVLLRILIRLLLVPIIAGIAYELLKLTGKRDTAFVRFITAPALFFQRFTTKEPSEDMIEVAITAVQSVYQAKE